MISRKKLYLSGYVVFIVGTALCGIAPHLWWLVSARILQGFGGSMLGANSLAILTNAVSQDAKPRAIALFTAAQGIGASLGPLVGGLLIESWGWQSVFWVAVPIGLAASICTFWFIPKSEDPSSSEDFDWWGALFLTPLLAISLVLLNESGAWHLHPRVITGCCVGLIVLMIALIRHERVARAPLVDPRLFGEISFVCSLLAVALGYALLYSMLFFTAFTLHGLHISPHESGLSMAIIPIALGIAAPLSSGLSKRMGLRNLSLLGMGLCLLALIVFSTSKMGFPFTATFMVAALAAFGIGLGIFIAPNSHATLVATPPALSGEAGAMVNLGRVLGSSLGVACGSSVLAWRLRIATGVNSFGDPLPGSFLFSAVKSSLLVLAAFSIVALAVVLIRDQARNVALNDL